MADTNPLDSGHTGIRKIIHIDMDAFFASVEQRDHPELRGKPVAVGGSAARGVVAAASYEARVFGVRSAMPSVTAKRKCPDLIFVKHRFEVYREVSRQIRAIFKTHSDLVEPLSLDEAYIDVTPENGGDKMGIGNATRIAEMIRAEIKKQTQLTASAGVSYNKFIAKIASDQNKPDGICVIKPHQGAEFVAQLPVRRFFGVGPKTAERMAKLDIHTGADLRAQSEDFLRQHFGKSAGYLFRASRGIDHRELRANRIRKSVGGERTYGEDLVTDTDLQDAFENIINIVWNSIEKSGSRGRTVTLKAKYADFRQVTRSKSADHYVENKQEFSEISRELLEQIMPVENGVRLLGLTLANLEGAEDSENENEDRTKSAQEAFEF
ncbi:DNA polymerase IV [Parasphingorhabdus halotolerans]|uniref:DNA polymerase IV n=1 Tax=Parasphingorhabdus halotolerans TaxID=2725558 RepID=A0A6H2DN28_9SPHN|nr:DNA polymerase IV [Parasphingorhabdus halotolerans]QJB69393.1 DNA polymerase IV [Parasphingorhabdus halotolerans]